MKMIKKASVGEEAEQLAFSNIADGKAIKTLKTYGHLL